VYGELGRYPVELKIKIKILLPLINNLNSNLEILPDNLSGLPTILFQRHNIFILIFNSTGYRPSSPYTIKFGVLVQPPKPWVNYIKSIFDETGFSNIWDGHKYINPELFKVTIKQRLQDQYIQKWFSDINNSSRGEYYSKFKTEFKLENYVSIATYK
jgi:hypothetical protein